MIRSLLPLAIASFLVAGCGSEQAPAPFTPEQGVSGKPHPEIGTVRGAIVDRPSADRALIEAHWALGASAEGCEIVLVLPEGASLVDGDEQRDVPEGQSQGVDRWLVQFPTGRPLDAVIRLCGTATRGHRIVEAYVRLAWE